MLADCAVWLMLDNDSTCCDAQWTDIYGNDKWEERESRTRETWTGSKLLIAVL